MQKKWIDKNEKPGLRLTLAERKLILEDPIHIHDEIADPIRATLTGFPVLITLDQVEDLGGHVAAEANHSTDMKLRKRLSPANPPNDGKQTPMRNHPIFVAQHGTATCCRGCLEKWHSIPKGRALTCEEKAYILSILRRWLISQGGV
jgi:Domain of unknown function (DUF4186)